MKGRGVEICCVWCKSPGMKSVKSKTSEEERGRRKTNKNDANTNNMFYIRMKLS